MKKRYPVPNVPLIEAKYKGGKQKPTLIMLDATFTTSSRGAAQGLANRRHQSSSPMRSSHYIVDESMAVRCVLDSVVATQKEPIVGLLVVELCDDPSYPSPRWRDSAHQNLLTKSAQLVADLCLAYDIPPGFLSDEELRKWYKRKKTTNGGLVDASQVYHDPRRGMGAWPAKHFSDLVISNIIRRVTSEKSPKICSQAPRMRRSFSVR